jgi:hypothetical protein
LAASSSNAANNGIDFGNWQPIGSSTAFSVALLAAPVNSANAKIAFSQRQTANNSNQIDIIFARNRAFSTDGRYVSFYLRDTSGNITGADNESTIGTSAPDGKMHLWGGTVAGSVSKLWRDGIDVTGGGGTASGTLVHSGQYTRIGNFADYSADGVFAYGANIAAVLVWSGRTLTAAEWLTLNSNPWQLFVGDPRRLYFDLARAKGTMRPTVRA